jgi:photosystem II stability/assembly factor-like uncharacterized protein
MKRILGILIYFLISTNTILGQWQLYNLTPTNINLNSIYFPSINVGYCVGDSGTILKTYDSGNNWNQQYCTFNNNLHEVTFLNDSIGWILSEDVMMSCDTLLFTIDGGSHWNIKSILPLSSQVNFINNDTGFITCSKNNNYYLLKTINGGFNWDTLYNTSKIFKNSFFKSNDTGYFGIMDTIYRTYDGGLNWIGSYCPLNPAYSITFIQNTGYVMSGFFGSLAKSTDGGITWQIKQSSLAPTSDFTISPQFSFPTKEIGYMIGNVFDFMGNFSYSYIYKTNNGGDSVFSMLNPAANRIFNSIFFINPYTGFICGNGIILKTTNGGETWIETNNTPVIVNVYPNPAHNFINISNSNIISQSQVQIISIDGKAQITKNQYTYNQSINISQLPKGMYIVKVISQNQSFVQIMLKE